MPKPFHELQSELLHLSQCLGIAAQGGIGCLNRIFKMWPDERFVQGEKNIGSKGREGSFQVKQHPTSFIGNSDIIFSTEPGVLDNSEVSGGDVGMVLVLGGLWDGRV